MVKFKVTNNAGLFIVEHSTPVLYDLSSPTPGRVVAGSDFTTEKVWFSSVNTVTGMNL